MGQLMELMDGLGPAVEGAGHREDAESNAAMQGRQDTSLDLANLRSQIRQVHS